MYVHKEACKPNNVTDHRQAMDDAVAAAVTQRAVTEERGSAAVSSDEQQSTDEHSAVLDSAELSKEDL